MLWWVELVREADVSVGNEDTGHKSWGQSLKQSFEAGACEILEKLKGVGVSRD